MASLLGNPPAPQRQPTKTNSTSAAAASLSHRASTSTSRTGLRPAGSTIVLQAPAVAKVTTINSSKRPISPEPRRRLNAGHGHSRSNSVGQITEGVGNLNRWSQSTVSSKSSGTTHKRRNSFARRLSGSFGSLGSFGGPQSPPATKIFAQKPSSSPGSSPQRPSPVAPTGRTSTRLPPVSTLSSLSHAANSADTPSDGPLATPVTADLLAPSAGDYFGDKWKNRSPSRQPNIVDRNLLTSPPPTSPSRYRDTEEPRPFYSSSGPMSTISAQNRQRPGTTQSQQRQPIAGTAQDRSHAHKSSAGTEEESSTSSIRSSDDAKRRRKAPSQKVMLSKALQKAKHAVLLDHAQNIEGAVAAYNDACNLLHQVMKCSSGDEDRRKLEAIRTTYLNRVIELQSNEFSSQQQDGKALPDVPTRHSSSTKSQELFSPIAGSEDEDRMSVRRTSVIPAGSIRAQIEDQTTPTAASREQLPKRGQSLMVFSSQNDGGKTPTFNIDTDVEAMDSWSIDSPQDSVLEKTMLTLAAPMEREYMPPPLSPRRPISPAIPETNNASSFEPPTSSSWEPTRSQHTQQDTMESTSWLDTIDESGGSSGSSVHSRTSSIGLRRKRIRAASGATEAEFDAALDAAIETAYNDGFEPDEDSKDGAPLTVAAMPAEKRISPEVKKKITLAKERSQEVERETAVTFAVEQEKSRQTEDPVVRKRSDSVDLDYDEDEAEDEERLLEEMTREYVLDDTEYNMQTKSALPRTSDSSGFSGRTWGSSVGSIPTTARTTLSTVAEAAALPDLPTNAHAKSAPPPLHPPPSAALPAPPRLPANVDSPPSVPPKAPPLAVATVLGVRERRLSGQRAKELKIDTGVRLPAGMTAPRTQPSLILESGISPPTVVEPPKSASLVHDSQQSVIMSSLKPIGSGNALRQVSSPLPGASSADSASIVSSATSASSKVLYPLSENAMPPIPHSPSRALNKLTGGPGTLRKNFSSSSLRSLKPSVTTSNTFAEDQPGTPLAKIFSSSSQTRNIYNQVVPDLPTPTAATFAANKMTPSGTNYLDSDIHSIHESWSSKSAGPNAPLPLEPCPEPFLLRPFWLMRCLYHSIAHPRGGYVSTRLFVPRDIWLVRNVKIKNIEDKVSNCDLLTAALLKLGKVDTLDADAVLEEMQAFEVILDQVQGILAKKLGGDVGLHGAAAFLKASPVVEDSETLAPRSTNTSNKSYLSTWRKLRSKNSSGPGLSAITSSMSRNHGMRDGLNMRSLPMTTLANPRFARRDTSKLQSIGPYANYMAALARLCDAAQVLDQIARQVEDPGLKHSSQTHVGLELSTRHAAEFFGFYVCRFALADMAMMMDKYVKRGSEWVLA